MDHAIAHEHIHSRLNGGEWAKIGLKAVLFSVIAVLVVQTIALAIWPDLVQFKPLDSYPRSALFTAVPAVGATVVFAWLAAHRPHPGKTFLALSAVILLLSFIPDFALPLPGKSLLGSSVAAFMHLTAGIVTVGTIVRSFRSRAGIRHGHKSKAAGSL